jgi:energy-coupling factor transport system permease protein
MNAQKSRGADFSSGSIVKRAKALIPILIPLFVSAFKRAEELATAMECRCYRGDNNRTKLVKLEFKKEDWIWLSVAIMLVISIILLSTIPYTKDISGVIFDILFYNIGGAQYGGV